MPKKFGVYLQYIVLFYFVFSVLYILVPVVLSEINSSPEKIAIIPLLILIVFTIMFYNFFQRSKNLANISNQTDFNSYFKFADVTANVMFLIFLISSFMGYVNIESRGVNMEIFSLVVSLAVIIFAYFQISKMELKKGLKFGEAVAIGSTTISFAILIIGMGIFIFITSLNTYASNSEYLITLLSDALLLSLPLAYIAKSDGILKRGSHYINAYIIINVIYILIIITLLDRDLGMISENGLRIIYFIILETLHKKDLDHLIK